MLAVDCVEWKAKVGDDKEPGEVGFVDVLCGNVVSGAADGVSVER